MTLDEYSAQVRGCQRTSYPLKRAAGSYRSGQDATLSAGADFMAPCTVSIAAAAAITAATIGALDEHRILAVGWLYMILGVLLALLSIAIAARSGHKGYATVQLVFALVWMGLPMGLYAISHLDATPRPWPPVNAWLFTLQGGLLLIPGAAAYVRGVMEQDENFR